VNTEADNDHRSNASGPQYRIAVRVAAIAGIFAAIVAILLLCDYARRPAVNPVDHAAITAFRTALRQQSDNKDFKEQIRLVDEQIVNEYFRQRAFTAVGGWLLVCGIAVCLIAGKSAATLRRKLPTPGLQTTPQDVESQWTHAGRWSVAALAVVLAGVFVALAIASHSPLPATQQELAKLLEEESAETPSPQPGKTPAKTDEESAPTKTTDNGGKTEKTTNGNGSGKEPNGNGNGPQPQPTNGDNGTETLAGSYPPPAEEEIHKNWPRFRGPGGLGISAYTNIPDAWDVQSGEGVLWKTPVPLPGKGSPVVWNDRVFLSGGTPEKLQVYCFDAKSGELLWAKDAPLSAPLAEDPEYTGYAAPTVATDGRHVFAVFATGDVAAFDYEGNLAWSRSFGAPENGYGHAASPIMYRDLLIVQIDQGSSAKKGLSRMYALRNGSGKTVWEVNRPVANSWTTPIVINNQGRDQLITCSDPWAIAYDPKDGSEIWKAKVMSGECGPSPVYAGGLVHVGNEYCQWTAIRPDGEGDVTETDHVAWTSEEGLPDMVSPLATDEFVLLMPSSSYFTCVSAKTGEMLWEYEFEEDYFTSSPSLVGHRIYLFSDEGNAFIIEPSDTEAKETAKIPLGEPCVTSPAFQDGRLYIRGETNLFCFGHK